MAFREPAFVTPDPIRRGLRAWLTLAAALLPAALAATAGSGLIVTVAGDGVPGYSGDNGPAVAAELESPIGVAVDAAGNVYIADWGDQVIRRVGAGGVISTVAGTGTAGFGGDNGPATAAELNGPNGLALDAAGNLYVADQNNLRVRRINLASGIISTVAGNGALGYNGDGMSALSAGMGPLSVAVDGAGNLYIADSGNDRVRKVSGGIISTVAGNGAIGYAGDGAAATAAELNNPNGLCLDPAGDLYITDWANNAVRKVAAGSGIISTVAGLGPTQPGSSGDGLPAVQAQLYQPRGCVVACDGSLYISDEYNNRIRRVDAAGIISTVAGDGIAGYSGDNIAAGSAELNFPRGIALDAAGNLYVADEGNQRVRSVSVGNCLLPSPTRSASPSASPTATTTPTASPSPSATLSATLSATFTDSPSPTPTATPSDTGTLTATYSGSPSASPTFSASPSATPSDSFTLTATFSASPSATPSATPTATSSSTPTATPTRTATPTATPTDSDTLTATFSDSPTATPTATPTDTPSDTPSDTPTRTATRTYTATPSSTVTPTDSPSFTDTPSSTITPTATPTGTDTATPSATPTATPSATRTATPSASPTATRSATPSVTPSFSPTFTITPTFTASPTRVPTPWHLQAVVYNGAGEKVLVLYDGGTNADPSAADLRPAVIAGWGSIAVLQLPAGVRTQDNATSLAWDGDNSQSAPVANGIYWIRLEVRDPHDVLTYFTLGVTVLRPARPSGIAVYNSAGERVAELAAPAGWDGVFSLEKNSGLSARLRVHGGDGDTWITWDGTGAQGQPLAQGSYLFKVDGGGSEDTQPFVLLARPWAVGALQAAPSPLRARDAGWSVRFSPAPGCRAVLRLYDLAGEQLRRLDAPADAGLLALDGQGLSSGLYILVLQVDGPRPWRQWTKLAVLR